MTAKEVRARVLVADDEPYIVDMVAMSLRYIGYQVDTASSGAETLEVAALTQPDLIILDVMLPDMLGFDLLRTLRRDTNAPVLFLTARDAVEDRVRGLTLGADDYVTKPFSLDELVARCGAILRRVAPAEVGPDDDTEASLLRYSDLVMDEDGHEVWRQGEPISLSPTEFSLLRFLMHNSGRVMSRAQILAHVWNYDFNGESGVVDSYIRYLRRKVDRYDPPLIETVRGVGYTLRLPKELR
ncbi:two-component system, OmpR family, response regulator [Tessaracoccus bendigoensis DSM 12906]|uniref:Two-component system, OmpR family, response regulator n=1 Tax=Tessaracoccus bendigoensis DSM 12906 TaxID=1123357 RepID=A0A1M6C7Y9_9ACTN|nr:response regulator transcription factor [Tessaracoccus bendigoensis]SHI57147.1 two-component system, OmpR family, response regulator [Tessaracoccus bendigoensis DSM 12906]